MKRKTNLSELTSEVFDIVVVGGGITGAGILKEASAKGYKCLLIEKNDFASGTSSKSAKLIHGGLRYLQYGQIGLVMESLKERDYLLKSYAHIVKPLPLLFPTFKSKFVYEVGLTLYQFFSKSKKIPKFKSLNKADTLAVFPFINQDKLEGSFIYYDAVTNDARLTCEVIMRACENKNAKALNYLELIDCETTKNFVEINCIDHIENKKIKIKTQYLINATGPWTDKVLAGIEKKETKFVEPGKGVHIVLSRNKFPLQIGSLFPSNAGDKRMLYVVPWENNTVIIGATDTEFHDNPDNLDIFTEEIDYLISALQEFTPLLNISKADILSVFVGLRPLYREEHKSTKDISRDYHVWWSNKRVLNILGGKLTTFRSMAKKCVKIFKEDTKFIPVKIKKTGDNHEFKMLDTANLLHGLVDRIEKNYECFAADIFAICIENKENQELVHVNFPVYSAEIIFFIRYSNAYFIEDILLRRFSLQYVLTQTSNADEIILKVAGIMKKELNWTDEFMFAQMQKTTGIVQKYKNYQK